MHKRYVQDWSFLLSMRKICTKFAKDLLLSPMCKKCARFVQDSTSLANVQDLHKIYFFSQISNVVPVHKMLWINSDLNVFHQNLTSKYSASISFDSHGQNVTLLTSFFFYIS